MSKLPLELLASFGKVSELGSITGAAHSLGMSKATVSKQISELEARLGVVLFARTTRKLTLTDAGKRAFARTSLILAEADLLAEDAHESSAAPRGRLKIAAPLTFSSLWLAPLLPSFMQEYPEIELEIVVDDRKVDVIAQGFDGAVRIGAMPDSSLIARRLASIKRYLVGAPGYWMKHGRPRHPSDLTAHNCVRYANLTDYSNWHFHNVDKGDVRVRVSGNLTLNGGNIELPIMRAGLGAAILPDFIICHDVSAGLLEIGLHDWQVPDLTLHFLTPPGRSKSKRLDVFTQFLVKHFGSRVAPWQVHGDDTTARNNS